jgi:FlaA1/EpsC-like NDP-sugar epimerase
MKIIVTGGAGSIGSELCRQLSKENTVIALDQDESGLFDLAQEVNIIPEICNIRDYQKLDFIIDKYRPDVIFHAAAYKHLSRYEREHFGEIVDTNIGGTKNLLMLCQKYAIKKFIFISTDKAVNPTSLMGSTKLVGEIMTKRNGYTVVRFGNVIGSRGSVIHIWGKQAEKKEPLSITEFEMKRFFMSIPDAVKLVIRASEIPNGGQTIILDMGEQRFIKDVAKELFPNSKLRRIGAKDGEKLEEELMTTEEKQRAIKQEEFFIIKNG